jgi:hypothetical protein
MAVAACHSCGQREEGKLVDEQRTSSAPTSEAVNSAERTSRSPISSPPTFRRLKTLMRAPMRSSTSSRPVAGD